MRFHCNILPHDVCKMSLYVSNHCPRFQEKRKFDKRRRKAAVFLAADHARRREVAAAPVEGVGDMRSLVRRPRNAKFNCQVLMLARRQGMLKIVSPDVGRLKCFYHIIRQFQCDTTIRALSLFLASLVSGKMASSSMGV